MEDKTDEMGEFEGEAGQEFSYLIRPVHDLRENWEIDFGNFDSFFDQLFEDEGVFNFAKAAMYIMRMADIYSRKVEYVYQQAANFFDQLKERPKKQRGRGGGDESGGEDGEGGEEGNGENARKKRAERRKQTLASIKTMIQKLEKSQRPTFPVIPIAFTPLADFEKHAVPLHNRIDPTEVVGNKDDFRCNTFRIYQGVALVDLKNLDLLDKFSRMDEGEDSHPPGMTIHTVMTETNNLTQRTTSMRDPAMSGMTGPSMEVPMGTSVGFDMASQGDVWMGDHGGGDDDDVPIGDDVGYAASNSSFGLNNLFPSNNGDEAMEEGGGEATTQTAAKQRRSVRIAEQRSSLEGARKQPRAAIVDWEAQLREANPYEEKGSAKSVPAKENRKCCIEAAKQVRTRDVRIERESRAKNVPNVPSVKAYTDATMYRRRVKMRPFAIAEFNTFIGDQSLLSLNPLVFEEEQRRAVIRRKRERLARAANRSARKPGRAGGEVAVENPAPSVSDRATGDGAGSFEDPMEEMVAADMMSHVGSDDIWMDNGDNLGDQLNVDELENPLGIQNLYANPRFDPQSLTRRRYFSSMGMDDGLIVPNYDDTFYPGLGDLPDDLPPRPISQMEYEEVVAFHLRKYWSTAEENQSKFAERVQQWEERMAPVLEREHNYRSFNTREYGSDLIDKFHGEIGTQVDFSKVLVDLPNYELSRYLLVTLILANTKNVELVPAKQQGSVGTGGTPIDRLQLKLLKTERHHEVLEDEQCLIAGGLQA